MGFTVPEHGRLCKVIYQKRHETLAFITINDIISLKLSKSFTHMFTVALLAKKTTYNGSRQSAINVYVLYFCCCCCCRYCCFVISVMCDLFFILCYIGEEFSRSFFPLGSVVNSCLLLTATKGSIIPCEHQEYPGHSMCGTINNGWNRKSIYNFNYH